MIGEDGGSDRGGHAAARYTMTLYGQLADRPAQFVGSLDELLRRSIGQNQAKFVPAVPAGNVPCADVIPPWEIASDPRETSAIGSGGLPN